MLKYIRDIAVVPIVLALVVLGFFLLQTVCSLDGHLPKLETPIQQGGSNKDAEHPDASQQDAPQKGEQTKPAVTFDLRIAEPNKKEGSYYAEKAEKEDWGRKFFCDVKIGEALVAAFTLFLVVYTARLYSATAKLADADRPHIFPGHFSISGMTTDGSVTVGFNFENCGRTPAYLENIAIVIWHAGALPKRPDFKKAKIIDIFFGHAPGKILFPAPGGAKADVSVDANMKTQILAGQNTLFVYGRINFKETSGKRHFQGFAYRYVPESDELFNCGPGIYWDHS
jgi:hypothetical protein